MIEIQGKYNGAKIFTDVVDSASIAQVQELCNQEFTAGSRIRMMPDIHAGAGCTIGTTMTITDKVVPNLVGVDIGCGMETVRIRETHLELQKLDKLIYEKIPSGFSIRTKAHRSFSRIDLSQLCCAKQVDLIRAEKSIGTLGGGNHFIEVDRDDEGNLYIVVHSGSRHLGVEVARYYQEAGYKVLNGTDDATVAGIVARMRAEGREKEIQKELKKLKNIKQTSIPKMCIRDRCRTERMGGRSDSCAAGCTGRGRCGAGCGHRTDCAEKVQPVPCLLYTSGYQP